MSRFLQHCSLTFFLFAALLFKITNSFDPKLRDQGCADFNKGAAQAALAGLENVFVCPADGISGLICADSFPLKNISTVFPLKNTSVTAQSHLIWNDTLIFLLMGPKSKTEAFLWWLPLMTEPLDIVIVADACPPLEPNCTDAVTTNVEMFHKKFPILNFHLIRSYEHDTGYKILSCKLRTGAAIIYKQFPKKKIYFKIDTDTIIFPKRLLSFFHTLDAVSEPSAPLYFGTVVESGMGLILCGREWTHLGPVAKGGICYGQGGAGYGLNNFGMNVLASSIACNALTIDPMPEDTFTAMRMYETYKSVVVHCGGFSSSEIMTDLRLRSSISFHYVDTKFLRTYGDALLKHIHHRR
jgi:hypothetical protein